MASHPPSVPEPTARAPLPTFTLRAGAAVGTAVLGAALAAVPPAVRVADAGAPRGPAWLALTAVHLVPMLGSVLVLRAARDGLRAFTGAGASARIVSGAVAAGVFAAALVVLGAGLRATTHHHALAGVTFAIFGAATAVLLGLCAARGAAALAARGPGLRALVLAASSAAGGLGLAGLGVALGRSSPAAAEAAATVVDALAFVLAALFASRPAFAGRRALALIGPPLAAAALVAGTSALRSSSALGSALHAKAPLASFALTRSAD